MTGQHDMPPHEATDDNFQDLLAATTRPALLEVWAPWCGPCKMVGPAVNRLAEKQPGRFQLILANIEDFAQTAEKLNIRVTPTLVLFRDGAEVARRSGAMMESQIAQWLDQTL